MLMGFGKHRSREVRWVVENDPSYIDWVFAHAAGSQAARAEAQQILTELRDCPVCGYGLTPVVWGLAVANFQENQVRAVEFGGCIAPANPAVWKCGACQRGFRRDLSAGSLGALVPLRPSPRSWPVRMSISIVKRLFP